MDEKKQRGVIKEIVRACTCEKGKTRKQILHALITKFPDRDSRGLTKTINRQLGWMLRDVKGIIIEKQKIEGRIYYKVVSNESNYGKET